MRAQSHRTILRAAAPAAAALLTILAAACADAPLTPPAATEATPPAAPRALGIVEVTLTGLAEGRTPTASVLSAPSVAGLARLRAQRRSAASAPGDEGEPLGPRSNLAGVDNLAATGDGTIELEPLSTGSFTQGERGSGGMRYLYATFRVRNAQTDSTAYDTERSNLTFLAVDTDATHGVTAVSRLITFGGTEITGAGAVALAESMIPTGAAVQTSPFRVGAAYPDVLQALTEAEADAVPVGGTDVSDVFPYGFVVRNASSTTTRTLAASPAPDQFDGVVTFAFKLPLQATPAEDPFEISAVFLAVDDSEVRITQSIEEQDSAAAAALAARAAALGASAVTLLPKARYDGPLTPRVLCAVRAAGLAAAPTGTLFPAPNTDPWLLNEASSLLSGATRFSAARCGAAWSAPDASSFVVHGSQSGRAFLGQAYTQDGAVVRTPAGTFFPGEEVEVVLTTGLGLSGPVVARYRVGGAAASANFPTATNHEVGVFPTSVAVGDLNDDGALDIVSSSMFFDTVSILLGNGSGGFDPPAEYEVEGRPEFTELGDLNGDGALDMVAYGGDDSVTVLLVNASGGFSDTARYDVGASSESIALGDVDGDGLLDIVTATDMDNVTVLLADGSGGFDLATTHAVGSTPRSVVLGDLNGDGLLDAVTANRHSHDVSVLIGDGSGGFDPATAHGAGFSPLSVALGDMNGDGALDIVTGNWGADDVSVLIGDGSGGFSAPVHHVAGESPRFLALGDLNGDGVLDIVTITGNDVSVLIGDGSGGFAAAAHYPEGNSLALGDVNGDGRIDLVTTSGTIEQSYVTVLSNQP